MRFVYTQKFFSTYKKLPKFIQKKAQKQEAVFRVNMFYPSLNTEKLSPKHSSLWSFRIDRAYRVVFHFDKNVVAFLYAGHHKGIYRLDF